MGEKIMNYMIMKVTNFSFNFIQLRNNKIFGTFKKPQLIFEMDIPL